MHNKAGDLYCISPEGTQIWQVRLNGEARGPLTIGPDGTLYVGYTGQSMGLAMVRQQAISLPPESFAFDRGVNLSGGLTDVLSSDNMYLGLQAGNTITAAESPVRMLFTIHSPYTPVSEIKISVETGNRVTGLACVTELWNVVTSRWEQIDVREVPASDTAYSLNVSNSQRFAAGDGLIKARIGFTAVGSVMQLRWTARLDYLHFDVVPQFVP